MGKALVIAGVGGVARGFLSVAEELCSTFEDVLLLDIAPQPDWREFCPQGQLLLFDIRKSDELAMLLAGLSDFVFVNLCTSIDNVEVRKVVASAGGAYIDTAGSAIGDTFEGRDSVLLPYTFSPVPSAKPQLVCCGINPGMVELLARMTLTQEFPEVASFDFESFEYDTLAATWKDRQPVSWCVSSLVDEVVGSPFSKRIGGEYIEGDAAPAAQATMLFDGEQVPTRIVCHEEVWTLGKVSEASVGRAFFSYAFREPVMEALGGADRFEAMKKLAVPDVQEIESGEDRVVVKISTTHGVRAYMWQMSHVETASAWRVNATQYQTAACLAVFLEWMLAGRVPVNPVPYCAADMPVQRWDFIKQLMQKYNVDWKPVDPILFTLFEK